MSKWWFINIAVSKLLLHSGKNIQASLTACSSTGTSRVPKTLNVLGCCHPKNYHPEKPQKIIQSTVPKTERNESANKSGSYYLSQKSKAIQLWKFSLIPCITWGHTLGKKCRKKIHSENPPQKQNENPCFIGSCVAYNMFEISKQKQNFGILPGEKNACFISWIENIHLDRNSVMFQLFVGIFWGIYKYHLQQQNTSTRFLNPTRTGQKFTQTCLSKRHWATAKKQEGKGLITGRKLKHCFMLLGWAEPDICNINTFMPVQWWIGVEGVTLLRKSSCWSTLKSDVIEFTEF